MLRLTLRRNLHYKTYPSIINLDSKEIFQQSIKNNELYQTLREKVDTNKIQFTADLTKINPSLNSLVTLSDTVSPITVERDHLDDFNVVPVWRRTPTLWYRIIKRLMKTYKEGVKGIYGIHKEYKSVSPVSYSNQELLKDLEQESLSSDVTRKRFVEMYRRNEFWKLPGFALMFFMFEELALLMVYIWPKLGLKSCLTVGAYKKITDKHVFRESLRNKMCGTVDIGKDTTSISSPYDLEIRTLQELLVQLPVNDIGNWKLSTWKLFSIKPKLANAVANKHQYFIVDDWLLLRNIMIDSEDSVISYNELVNMIAERQLYKKGEDLNKMVNDDIGRKILITRMILYWSFRFDGVNILKPQQKGGFTDKWGVNNISILNFPGTLSEHGDKVELFDNTHLNFIK